MSEQIRIPHIDTYNQEIINGELILTPNKEYITESELNIIDIKIQKFKIVSLNIMKKLYQQTQNIGVF